MDLDVSIYWVLPLILFFYCGVDLITTKSLVRKHSAHPLVGSPSPLLPSVILNLIFAGKAAQVVEKGYRKVIVEPLLDLKLRSHQRSSKTGPFKLSEATAA